MTETTPPEVAWQLSAHEDKLGDHESRLRVVEKDVNAAHDGLRALRASVKSSLDKMQLRVGLYALSGAVLGTIGKDALGLLKGLLP